MWTGLQELQNKYTDGTVMTLLVLWMHDEPIQGWHYREIKQFSVTMEYSSYNDGRKSDITESQTTKHKNWWDLRWSWFKLTCGSV